MTTWRRSAAAAALLVVLAACGGGGKDKDPGGVAAGGDQATSTSTEAPAAGGGGEGGGSGGATTTTAKQAGGGATTTSTTRSSTGGGGATTTSPAKPIAAGTYQYDTSGQATVDSGVSQTTKFPAVTSLKVDPANGSAQHRLRDLRDAQGNGVVVETDLVYQADGIRLAFLRQTVQQSGLSDVREFRPSPAPMFLATGAAAGATDSYRLAGSGVTADVTVKVIGDETVATPSGPVAAVHIRVDTRFSGDVEGSSQADNWIRRSDGLLIKEHVVTDATTGLNHYTADYTATIRAL